MRFELDHPSDERTAAYGWDRALGFFVSLRDTVGDRRDYDATGRIYDPRRPLQGALDFLVRHGFLDRHQLESALSSMQHSLLEELEPSLRRPGEVVLNFKRAAD
jgi:hypothetical protein